MNWTKRTTPTAGRDVELADESGDVICDESGDDILLFSHTAWSKR